MPRLEKGIEILAGGFGGEARMEGKVKLTLVVGEIVFEAE